MILWKAEPGEGKRNTLDAVTVGDGQVEITLTVEKPGGKWKAAVLGRMTLEQLEASLRMFPPDSFNWVEAKFESHEKKRFLAIRFFQIAGTALKFVWHVDHYDRNGDGTAFDVRDEIRLVSTSFVIGGSSHMSISKAVLEAA